MSPKQEQCPLPKVQHLITNACILTPLRAGLTFLCCTVLSLLLGLLSLVIGYAFQRSASLPPSLVNEIPLREAAVLGLLGGIVLMPMTLLWLCLNATLFEQLCASEAEARRRYLRSVFTGVIEREDVKPGESSIPEETRSSFQTSRKLRKAKPEKPEIPKEAGYMAFCPFSLIQAPFNLGFGAAAGTLGSCMIGYGTPSTAAVSGCVGGEFR